MFSLKAVGQFHLSGSLIHSKLDLHKTVRDLLYVAQTPLSKILAKFDVGKLLNLLAIQNFGDIFGHY